MTFPASVTRALALPSRQGSPEVCAHSPTTPLAAGRHTTWALPRTACAHLQQPGNAPNHPAATRRQLFPPRSCRLRQIKPNKEPALGCGLVHRSVSSACGPNRSSLLQQRRPQAEEISIDHATRHRPSRSEEHTSELQSPCNLVCRLLLEKKSEI